MTFDLDAFAAAWVRDWNAHDLTAILAHYADPLEFRSPLILKRGFGQNGCIRSKEELGRYFAVGLSGASDLKFDLIQTVSGVDTHAIVYRNHRGQLVVETLRLNAQGLVAWANVLYAPLKASPI